MAAARVGTGRARRATRRLARTRRLPGSRPDWRRFPRLFGARGALELCPRSELVEASWLTTALALKEGPDRDGYHPTGRVARHRPGGQSRGSPGFRASRSRRTGITSSRSASQVFATTSRSPTTTGAKGRPTTFAKQTSRNAERYITPELKESKKVLRAEDGLRA